MLENRLISAACCSVRFPVDQSREWFPALRWESLDERKAWQLCGQFDFWFTMRTDSTGRDHISGEFSTAEVFSMQLMGGEL